MSRPIYIFLATTDDGLIHPVTCHGHAPLAAEVARWTFNKPVHALSIGEELEVEEITGALRADGHYQFADGRLVQAHRVEPAPVAAAA